MAKCKKYKLYDSCTCETCTWRTESTGVSAGSRSYPYFCDCEESHYYGNWVHRKGSCEHWHLRDSLSAPMKKPYIPYSRGGQQLYPDGPQLSLFQ